MSKELLDKAVAASLKTEIPDFRIGDIVNVSVRIVEGDRERVQVFTGTVIARKGGGVHETFTVRRIVNNEGVERVFPIHSPRVAGIEVVRGGRVRRAKLYYLRDRTGKATRLKEEKRRIADQRSAELAERKSAKAAADAAAAQAAADAEADSDEADTPADE
ncbi:MAG: 50S ribosomal protein L19 [Planctomycetota bacterium]